MIEGTLIADVIASMGSMDFVLGDRTGRRMTFSPQLEAKFAKLLTSYPPGRSARRWCRCCCSRRMKWAPSRRK